ncbi:MAG TPA: bifunctional metallophosphatase/5'-nucleotidase [Flavobacteriia bacterium]|nr:bifunctional metallophosphatase/5'-nucleotidase [Flavobacteriia bacterium]
MKKIITLLLLVILIGCNKEDHQIKVTLLQLNDVYEIAPLEGGKVGGMARVETIHKQLLQENPNTFMVMAGDFLNPSLIGTIKVNGERVRGKQMIDVMNAMNFDLVNFGNHEFDLKYKDLQKRLNESNFQWISTNAKHRLDSTQIKPFYTKKSEKKIDIPNTYIKEFTDADGTKIKIGFIGPTINSNPKDYVDYGDFYEDSKNAYKQLKDKVDVVIGLTHLQQNQDEMLLKMLPEMPLIMGGHEHTNRLIPIGNGKIAKADANAKTVYIHRLTYDTKSKKLAIESELLSINNKIKEDKNVARIVQKWVNLLDDKIKTYIKNPNEVIYFAKEPLDGRDTPIRSMQTNLGQIIARGMAYGYDDKVDAALVNGGSIRIDDELEGDITAIDIFRVLPYGGSVLKVQLKGNLLEKVLQYGKLKAGNGAYLQRYNAAFDKQKKQWLIKGKPIDKNKIYTVAFSDYLLKGYDIPFLKPDNKDIISVYKPKENEMSSDIRKSVINYLKTLNQKE